MPDRSLRKCPYDRVAFCDDKADCVSCDIYLTRGDGKDFVLKKRGSDDKCQLTDNVIAKR